MESEVVTEVPDVLKQLMRRLARGFYSVQHSAVIDILIRYPCVKEDDMLELLKFERKQLRAVINTLKNEKLLKSRMTVETDSEGHTTRHSYYFINYQVFVNVTKYKLDIMRKKLEAGEREITSRASFQCDLCEKTFTEYEINEIFDPMTQELLCSFCKGTVTETQSALPEKQAKNLLALFNEQMQPIFTMLRECEDFKLSAEILEPPPTDIRQINKTHGASQPKAPGEAWSGEANKKRAFNYVDMDNQVTISMDNEAKTSDNVNVKDRPIWMTHSTVEGISEENMDDKASETATSKESSTKNNDIIQTLLIHEKKGSISVPSSRPESSSSDSEEETMQAVGDVEEMDSDEEDGEDDNDFLVIVGGTKVPYNNITPEMVSNMNTSEREEYRKVGQMLYENMYE